MTASPTVLIVSLAIGIPIVLLALGVFYHAWVISRQAAPEMLIEHVGAMATPQADEVLQAVTGTMRQIQDDLAAQRASLSSMLSDAARSSFTAEVPAVAHEIAPAPTDMRTAVRRLVAEGLSDRAIARRLHVGLEEVRMARFGDGGAAR